MFQPSLSASCLPQAATYRLVFGLHSSENKLFIWSFLIILTLSALRLSACCSSSLNTVLPWDCISSWQFLVYLCGGGGNASMKLRGLCFKCLNSCSCLLMLLKYYRKAVPVFGKTVMATRACFQHLL